MYFAIKGGESHRVIFFLTQDQSLIYSLHSQRVLLIFLKMQIYIYIYHYSECKTSVKIYIIHTKSFSNFISIFFLVIFSHDFHLSCNLQIQKRHQCHITHLTSFPDLEMVLVVTDSASNRKFIRIQYQIKFLFRQWLFVNIDLLENSNINILLLELQKFGIRVGQIDKFQVDDFETSCQRPKSS